MYQMHDCSNCIHYPICVLRKDYEEIEKKIIEVDENILKDNHNFSLSLDCVHFLHTKVIT